MAKHRFIDFAALKAAVKLEDVLAHYGLLQEFKRGSDSLSGCCPIHKGSNPTQFRVSLSKNCWNCFSDCKCGGNVLDLIERLENCTTIEAANRLVDWFKLDVDSLNGSRPERPPTEDIPPKEKPIERTAPPVTASKPVPAKGPDTAKVEVPEAGANKPLGFSLAEKLDYGHSYLAERGLTPESIQEFGVGFCNSGSMFARVCIPIHSTGGELVGYVGRWPGEPSGETPKYKLPKGFKKSVEVFNLHRALRESEQQPLILVEGFFDVFRLWQLGYRKVAALMGSSLSVGQETLIAKSVGRTGRLILMFDEDDAGRHGRDDALVRFAPRCFVSAVAFPQEDMQPEHLTPELAAQLLEGAL